MSIIDIYIVREIIKLVDININVFIIYFIKKYLNTCIGISIYYKVSKNISSRIYYINYPIYFISI